MSGAVKRSREFFESGFCCAESVLMAVAERMGIESDLIPKIATGLCAGMSKTSSRCGALTGGVLALGMIYGRAAVGDSASKDLTYELVAQFVRGFETMFGSADCRELLGCDISTEEGMRTFEEQGLIEKCYGFAEEATAYLMKVIEKAASVAG